MTAETESNKILAISGYLLATEDQQTDVHFTPHPLLSDTCHASPGPVDVMVEHKKRGRGGGGCVVGEVTAETKSEVMHIVSGFLLTKKDQKMDVHWFPSPLPADTCHASPGPAGGIVEPK